GRRMGETLLENPDRLGAVSAPSQSLAQIGAGDQRIRRDLQRLPKRVARLPGPSQLQNRVAEADPRRNIAGIQMAGLLKAAFPLDWLAACQPAAPLLDQATEPVLGRAEGLLTCWAHATELS